jgi:hypothetical protein
MVVNSEQNGSNVKINGPLLVSNTSMFDAGINTNRIFGHFDDLEIHSANIYLFSGGDECEDACERGDVIISAFSDLTLNAALIELNGNDGGINIQGMLFANTLSNNVELNNQIDMQGNSIANISEIDGQSGNDITISSDQNITLNPNSGYTIQANGPITFVPTSAPVSANTGDTYYDSGTNIFYYFNGSTWIPTGFQGIMVNSHYDCTSGSPARSTETVYQNNSSKSLLVQVSFGINNNSDNEDYVYFYCDASSAPSTIVCKSGVGATNDGVSDQFMSYWVEPGNFYSITRGFQSGNYAVTFYTWIESQMS